MKELHPRVRQLIDEIVDDVKLETQSHADDLVAAMTPLSSNERNLHYRYWDCRLAGSSPKLAEMLALQSPPMSNTDREFLEGHCDGNQFAKGPLAEEHGDRLRVAAEAGGQNVKGKIYIGGLARFPGDPQAWVSDRGDVKRVVESRGWKCEGAVEVNQAGWSDEKGAMYREGKVAEGPGLDMDEDGYVEVATGPQGEVIEAQLSRSELVERR